MEGLKIDCAGLMGYHLAKQVIQVILKTFKELNSNDF